MHKITSASLAIVLSLILAVPAFAAPNGSPATGPNSSPAKTSFTVSCAGDCTLGEYKGQSAGGQFKDYFSNGADYYLKLVKPIFEADDITLVNLEGPLTDHKQTAVKKFPIKGDPKNLEILTSSSVEVCNLSNNHIYDCGQEGYNDTKSLLDSAKIAYCGEGNKTIQEVKLDDYTAKVGFLGYQAWSTDIISTMKQEVADLSKNCDVVIVSFHGGTEGTHESNSTQEQIYRSAIDAGADLVVGTHPHVLQGIEKYNGGIIAYSLGNFSFGANKNPKDKQTAILQQEFNYDKTEGVTLGKTTVIPCRISSTTSCNNYQPQPLTDTDEGNNIINNIKAYSTKYAESIF